MEHPTQWWAARYGLPDPGPIADEVLALAPTELSNRFGAVAELGRRIERAVQFGDAAIVTLAAGWSNPHPREVLQAIAVAARHGGLVVRAQSDAALRTASVMDAAQAAVRGAYRRADETIVRHDLLRGEPLAALVEATGGDDPLRAARIAVVTALAADVTRARDDVTSAVAELNGWLAEDPREQLRAFGPQLATAQDLPGSPARSDRDNRAALVADLTSANPVRARFAAEVLGALSHADAAAPPGTTVQLLVYDPLHPEDQGGAAIGIGDVSTADDVAVLVPGVGNSPAVMDGAVDAADRLRAAAQAADPSASVATIAWLGYDVPLSWPHGLPSTPTRILTDSVMALGGTEALGAGAQLALFTSGLRARMSPSARLTLVGHSYGSMVVSRAATYASGIDDIVLLGAPGAGAGVHDAGDYRDLGPGHVFALSFEHDPVTTSVTDILTAVVAPPLATLSGATFGPDPAADGFGAQVIDAASAVPVMQVGGALAMPGGLAQGLLVNAVTGADQHPLTNYLGGAAGLAVGAVVVGRYTAVSIRKGR